MLRNKDIIVFSDDWGRYPSTLQHIINYILPYNRIFWIGSFGLRRPKLAFKDVLRILGKLKLYFRRSTKLYPEENLILFNPFIIPYHDLGIVRKINNYNLKKYLRRKYNQYKLKDVLLFTSNVLIADIYEQIKPGIGVYFCLDDYTKFDGAFKIIEILEKKLLEKVEISFCVSDLLVRTRKPLKGSSYHLPQGIHSDHFLTHSKTRPIELSNVSHPIVGFFGLFSHWTDIDLISECASKYSEYNFVLIGPSDISLDTLIAKQNVIYLGPKAFKELPEYASCFDVGLIPFKINDLTLAVNPLKLLEYFSLGIPVVSTPLPEVAKFGDLVYIGTTMDEFIQKIKTAVEENDDYLRKARIEKAKQYSWVDIADNICRKISTI